MNKKKFNLVILSLFLTLILCFKTTAFAQEKVVMEDKIIGSTFKALAKAFIVIADINKLKKNGIDKLNKMDEEKFQRRYAKVYEVIKDLPFRLKVSYGVTEHMTKEQAIKNIESLDKKKIYEIIDLVPDTIIANNFKQYLNKRKQVTQKSNIVEQINKFWNKMLEKINVSTRHPVYINF